MKNASQHSVVTTPADGRVSLWRTAQPSRLCWAVIGSLLGMTGLPAHAQRAQTGLEEIVVTAQRREEALQDVPIAVTAMSDHDLEVRKIEGLDDLTGGAIPSLNIQNFASRPGVMQVTIRGVGTTDPVQISFEPAIAVYADGVYIARGQGAGLELLDLERLEVLRGPQGTLFGRNAVGGAINMIGKKPGGELRFRQSIDYGRYDMIKARTTVETPTWKDLAFKFDYMHQEQDGWQKNPGPDQNDFGMMDQDSWRAAVRWKPNDDFTADYVFDYADLKYLQGYNHLIINSNVPAFAPILQPFVETDRSTHVPLPGLWGPPSTTESEGHALTLEWAINQNLTVKSITGYRDINTDTKAINGFGVIAPSRLPPPNPTFFGGNSSAELTNEHQFSQEFQLFGGTERLQYTLGAMYFEEEASNTNFSRTTLTFSPPTFQAVLLTTPIVGPQTTTSVDLKSLGLYGQVTWTPPIAADRFHVTAGLRYSDDKKDLLRTVLNGASVHVPIEADEDRVDPALTFAYDLAESVSVYTRWATAYRGGGASVRELPVASDPTDNGFHAFGPEEVELMELGLKSEFWDRRARVNVAGFYQEYRDKQVSFQKDSVANTRVFNVDKTVIIKGGEIETTVRATEGLTLNLSATYLDDNITSVANPTSGLEEPFRLAQFPKWRWGVNADYVFPWKPADGTLDLFVSLTGSTSYCFNERSCFGRFAELRGGSDDTSGEDNRLLDARLALSDIPVARGSLQVALWGKNLTDQEWYNFGFTVPGVNTGIVNYGMPRTYGVTLTYEFDGQ